MTSPQRFAKDEATRLENRSEGRRVRNLVVTGPHAVFGKNHGETVSVYVSDAEANALISGGHVVEAPVPVTKTPVASATTAAVKTEDVPSVPAPKES